MLMLKVKLFQVSCRLGCSLFSKIRKTFIVLVEITWEKRCCLLFNNFLLFDKLNGSYSDCVLGATKNII